MARVARKAKRKVVSGSAEKMRRHRDEMRRRGFKLVQFWAPDPDAPGFKAAVRATRAFLEAHPDADWDAYVARQLDQAPGWSED